MSLASLQRVLLLLVAVATFLVAGAYFVAGFPPGALLPLLPGGLWLAWLRAPSSARQDTPTLLAVLLIACGAGALWTGERPLAIVYTSVGLALVGWQLSLVYGRIQSAPHSTGVTMIIAAHGRRSTLFFLAAMLGLPLWLLLPGDLNFDTTLLLGVLLLTGIAYLVHQIRHQQDAKRQPNAD